MLGFPDSSKGRRRGEHFLRLLAFLLVPRPVVVNSTGDEGSVTRATFQALELIITPRTTAPRGTLALWAAVARAMAPCTQPKGWVVVVGEGGRAMCT